MSPRVRVVRGFALFVVANVVWGLIWPGPGPWHWLPVLATWVLLMWGRPLFWRWRQRRALVNQRRRAARERAAAGP